MNGDFRFIIGVALCFVVVIVGAGVADYVLSRASCERRWPQRFEPRFGLWTGCTIVVNGERIPDFTYRVIL